MSAVADSLQDSLADRDERILMLGRLMEKNKKNDSKYIRRMIKDGQLLRETVNERISELEREREQITASNKRIEAEKVSILQYTSPVLTPTGSENSKASTRADYFKELFLYGNLTADQIKAQAILLSTEICLTEAKLCEREGEVSQAMGEKRVLEMRADATWDLRDHEVRAKVWGLRRNLGGGSKGYHSLIQERTQARTFSKDLLIDEMCRGAYLDSLKKAIEACEYERIGLRLLEDVRSIHCPDVVRCDRDHGHRVCFNSPPPPPEID